MTDELMLAVICIVMLSWLASDWADRYESYNRKESRDRPEL